MANKRSALPSASPSARDSIISDSVFVTSTQIPSDNVHDIFSLFKPMRGKRSLKMISLVPDSSVRLMSTNPYQRLVMRRSIREQKQTPQFLFNQPKNKERRFDLRAIKNRFQRGKEKLFKSARERKHPFNSTAYCVAYCTVILIGTTIGGWVGGLFEFLFDGHNGCNNGYRGKFNCQMKYASANITTHCINIFYQRSIPNNSPYICLCRFRNQSKAKYRDCEFLHAKIQ